MSSTYAERVIEGESVEQKKNETMNQQGIIVIYHQNVIENNAMYK